MSLEDQERLHRAQHAMQTGVATMMGINANDMTVKHLRVGINASMVEIAALAKLLIKKGIITLDEYDKALADEMEAEVERYRQEIKDCTGMDVMLI